jgi:hypothetical protein
LGHLLWVPLPANNTQLAPLGLLSAVGSAAIRATY